MKSRRRKDIAAARIALLGALIAPVGAEAQTLRAVRIDYDAAPGCPDEKSFEAQLRARSSKILVAVDGSMAIRVRIAAHGGRFEGEVSLSDANGHESRRQVDGGCGDVAAALALITALALDPTASTAAPGQPTEAASPTAAGETNPSPALLSAKPLPAGEAHDPRGPAGTEALSDQVALTHGWAWSVGAHAAIRSGVTPAALFSVPAFLDVWRRSASAFAPALRLRFERADSGSVLVAGGGAGADFVWTAGSLDLCPVGWSPSRFRFAACVRGEAGALSATGVGVSPTRGDTRPWVTVAAVARARLAVVGSLFVEVEGEGFAPLVRDRFFVERDVTIQRAPALAAAGAAGIGVTFW